jgi:hypothetical protein
MVDLRVYFMGVIKNLHREPSEASSAKPKIRRLHRVAQRKKVQICENLRDLREKQNLGIIKFLNTTKRRVE